MVQHDLVPQDFGIGFKGCVKENCRGRRIESAGSEIRPARSPDFLPLSLFV